MRQDRRPGKGEQGPHHVLWSGHEGDRARYHRRVYTVEGNKVHVTVGAVEHPMAEEHYIEWVSLQTKSGNQRKALQPGQEPKTCFALCEGDEVEAVYAYCNLHGLWKA